MFDRKLRHTLKIISEYFGRYRVGYEGNKGYRKTTDLFKLTPAIEEMSEAGLLHPRRTIFMDLGCGDGRVNLLMSYFVKISIGVEIDVTTLDEYEVRRRELDKFLMGTGTLLPPENIFVFSGNSLEPGTEKEIITKTGYCFKDIDLFYTYITLHDQFAEKIEQDAKKGALYLIYGFNKILPRYDLLTLVNRDVGKQGIMALYKKV